MFISISLFFIHLPFICYISLSHPLFLISCLRHHANLPNTHTHHPINLNSTDHRRQFWCYWTHCHHL
jgi:hypothetical protein